MIVPGLAAVAGSRAQPRRHQNHNPGGNYSRTMPPAGASQKGASKGSRKYTKSGLQGKRPGGTPRIWPTTRLTRTKPCMALNLATVLHFQDTDWGLQNPGRHVPQLMAMSKGAARGARRDPPRRHFCRAIWVPRIVPYISPQTDKHTLFCACRGEVILRTLGCPGLPWPSRGSRRPARYHHLAPRPADHRALLPPTNQKLPYKWAP